jgi:thioredoxin 1
MFLSVLPMVLATLGQAAPPRILPPVPTTPAQVVQRPAPKPYNEAADAKKLIDDAVKAAATDGIRVLVNWGANDDDGSVRFAKARTGREMSTFWSDEYKVANIDVGHLDRNLDIAQAFGVTLRAGDLPVLAVLDATGQVLARTSATALKSDADTTAFDQAKIAAFLRAHQAPAPDANPLFEAAVRQAKRDGKTAFVWFSAPW